MKKIVNYITIGVVAIVIIVLAVVVVRSFTSVAPKAEVSYGATTFLSGITTGNDGYTRGTVQPVLQTTGTLLATSTAGSSTATITTTIPAANIQSYQGLIVSLTAGSSTFKFPASSTLATFIPIPGETAEFYIINATGTAGVQITASSSAGVTIKNATSSLTLDSGAVMKTVFIRRQNRNIDALVNIYR